MSMEESRHRSLGWASRRGAPGSDDKDFKKAGFDISVSERSYFPAATIPLWIDPPTCPGDVAVCGGRSPGCRHLRARLVEENGSDVAVVANLIYAKQGMRPVRWVLAVPEKSDVSIRQRPGRKTDRDRGR